MPDFLEERISQSILAGSSFQDDYAVNISMTSGGQEYRSLIHAFPVRKFDISYLFEKQAMWPELLGLYHRAHGKYAGFRIRCIDDWKSCQPNGTPTAFDQSMLLVSAGVYQLRKYYGVEKAAGASGYPYRIVHKPVAGTVKVGIGLADIRSADWSISTTTGRITFAADQTYSITGISKATSADLTLGSHALVVGQSIHIASVSGMTQINGLRAFITATTGTTATVDINSSAFDTYVSGGAVHTRPQSGETVTAGFEFDIPVRFNSTIPIGQDLTWHRSIDGVELIELLNP